MPLRLLLAGLCLPLASCAAPWYRAASDDAPPARGTSAELASYDEPNAAEAPSPNDRAIGPESDSASELMSDEVDAVGRAVEAGQALTLEEALAIARAHHPLLRARRHEVDMARGRVIAAARRVNPAFVFDVDNPNQGYPELSARLMFTVELGGKRGHRIQVALEGVHRAEMALARETKTVLAGVAEAAVEVLYLERLVELEEHVGRTATQLADVQREQAAARAIARVQAFESEVEAAEAESERLDALGRLAVARLRLAEAMGMNHPRPVELRGELAADVISPKVLDAVVTLARQRSPEVDEALAGLAERMREHELAWAERWPDLQFGPRWSEDLHTGGGSEGARIDLELPLWDRNQGAIETSAAAIGAAQAMVEVAEADALGELAQTAAEMLPLQRRLAYFSERIIPMADRIERALDEARRARAVDVRELVRPLRQIGRMRREHLDALYRYNRLRVKLAMALDQPLDEIVGERPVAQHPAPRAYRAATPYAAMATPQRAAGFERDASAARSSKRGPPQMIRSPGFGTR